MYVRFCHITISIVIVLTNYAAEDPRLGSQNLLFFLSTSFFKRFYQFYDFNYHEELDNSQIHASSYLSYEF